MIAFLIFIQVIITAPLWFLMHDHQPISVKCVDILFFLLSILCSFSIFTNNEYYWESGILHLMTSLAAASAIRLLLAFAPKARIFLFANSVIFAAIAVSGGLCAVLGFGQPSRFTYLGVARWSIPEIDPNLFAHFISLSLLVTIVYLVIWKGESKPSFYFRLIAFLSCLIQIYVLLMSMSRGGALAFVLGVALMIVYLFSNYVFRANHLWPAFSRPYIWRIHGVALIGILLGVYCFDKLSDDLISRLCLRWASAFDAADRSWVNRVETWSAQLNLLADNLLFGIGWIDRLNYFGDFYLPMHLWSPAAFDTNDFLALSCVLGAAGGGIIVLLTLLGLFFSVKIMTNNTCSANYSSSSEFYQFHMFAVMRPMILFSLLIGFILNGLLMHYHFGFVFFSTIVLSAEACRK